MKDLHTLVPSQVNLEINFNSNPVKALNPLVLAFMASVRKGRGIGDAVADLGEGPAPHPLKIFFYTGHPPYLRAWMIAPSPTPPPPPLLSAGLEPPLRQARNHLLLFFQTPATLAISFKLPFIARQSVVSKVLSTFQISTKRIIQLVSTILIHWTVIYKVDIILCYPMLQNDLPFFHSPDLWRLLVFLLPLVHSLVCCLCYPTVVCSVIICSLLSQLPGNTNLLQKLRYLSSTCDVRKRRSVHEQSQE